MRTPPPIAPKEMSNNSKREASNGSNSSTVTFCQSSVGSSDMLPGNSSRYRSGVSSSTVSTCHL